MPGLAVFIANLFRFYNILIIVWCILSWFPMPREGVLSDIVGAIDTLVSPYINLFRRFLPPFGGLDFSPVLAIVVLGVIQRFIMVILLR